ncbi:hypothetical protein [Novosphingobium mangrovi (ex Huang et al. 2023)]|uniref:Uncharacterized protein n=1 Tax=Novosphingobium mangrovi (ex Huang et al. 2023) TaxID=2976432 RepID=A0ABT2I5B4_9SPHN|nr:hypothetical protein [Novosphingobium mangrovi (ex Huang et al. 2023)]MCT2399998.1 hypothetical protein [Novosphingobium mangrovi (ex Huang et al. 2023)]
MGETVKTFCRNCSALNWRSLATSGRRTRGPIASDHGTVRTRVKAEERLQPGLVSMTHMFGPLVSTGDPEADGGANVGQLCSLTRVLEPVNFMPRFSAIPVTVQPYEKD